jgi:predicted DNA-binding transcriptional regulator YafY
VPKNSYLDRKNRHDKLLGLLKSREIWTTGELSETLRVSLRTLMRDLRDLESSGLPIETDRGRGGGIRLHQSWGLGKLHLNYEEILDLLVALATMEKMPSPLLLKNLRSVRLKIAQSFPDSQRSAIEGLRKRIWIGDKASDKVLASLGAPKAAILPSLQRGFFESKQIKIGYTDEKKRRTERTIEPHHLIFTWPVWYVLAWDLRWSDTRFFRVDRIDSCAITTSDFESREKENFEAAMQGFFESV